MSTLADPTICPDCRAPLDATATCSRCRLPLAGPAGQRLWQAMLGADRLVEEIRATARVPSPAPVTGATRDLPAAPRLAPPAARRGVPAASVPVVLLSLGALCLLVAAAVFVAIAWGALGLTGRTLVLVGVTAALGAGAGLVTGRHLRGAGEALWTVVAGMVTLDLLAARAAGLAGLDRLDWHATSVLLGTTLAGLGVAVTLAARRTTGTDLWAPQVVTVLGALVAATGGAWLADDPALGAALAVPCLAVAGAVLVRPLREVASVLLGLAAVSWLELTAVGLDRATEFSSWSAWWHGLRGWPLVVAAAFAAVAMLPRPVPHRVRVVLAGAALVPLAVLANAPATTGTETRDAAVRALTVVGLAVLARRAPRTWARAAASLAAVAALGLLLQLGWQPWSAVELLPARTTWTVPVPAVEYPAAAWTWAATGIAVALAALASRTPASRHSDLGVAVAVSAVPAGLAVTAAAAQVPLWASVTGSALAALVVAGATWSRRVSWSPTATAVGSVAAGYLLLTALAEASPSTSLTAIVSTTAAVVLAIAFVAAERQGGVVGPAATGATSLLLTTYALPAWTTLASLDADVEAVAVAVLAVVAVLAAAPLTRRTTTRWTLELSALVPALAAALIAPDPRSLAVVLTVVGSGAAALSVLHRDRQELGWAAAAVLGTATAVRVLVDVRAPELYTLPAAGLLLAVGLWRMRTDATAESVRVLGAGLALALVPSLLLALEEPLSLRGVLVGAGGLVALTVGVRQRASAPMFAGAATVALLALRELEPLADAVPRWVTLAALGLVLLGVGTTWESRLRNLRAAGRYLTALR